MSLDELELKSSLVDTMRSGLLAYLRSDAFDLDVRGVFIRTAAAFTASSGLLCGRGEPKRGKLMSSLSRARFTPNTPPRALEGTSSATGCTGCFPATPPLSLGGTLSPGRGRSG